MSIKFLQNHPCRPVDICIPFIKNSSRFLMILAVLILGLSGTSDAQTMEVSGTVVDANTGEPLVGAEIVVKGTRRGTTSGLQGDFSIRANSGAILEVYYIGYASRDVAVTSASVKIELSSSLIQGESVTVVGSRGKPRTNVERPVPIDVINVRDIQATGQPDLGQAIHYTAPSFNAVKFGINDLAPLVDPATLRGLGPDQTLLLVNGKRRHKVSFFNLNDGLGKGTVGNDINAIPAAAVKRIEVLRDGAAAQYGSDAIAGVVNMELKNASRGGSLYLYTGTGVSQPTHLDGTDRDGEWVNDGETVKGALNFGRPFGQDGFVNTTIHFHHSEAYDRSGTYSAGRGFYTSDEAEDARLVALNGIDLDRAVLGAAQNSNTGIFINAGKPLTDDWDLYSFGGFTFKRIIGGIFTRPPSRFDRAVPEIFPDGFNPETPTNLYDMMFVFGSKGKLGAGWDLDLSAGYGGNKVDFFNRNTVNPSMGANSPTQFFTGGTAVGQTTFNADLVKSIINDNGPDFSIAIGSELRFETFEQRAGQAESYLAGPFAVPDSAGRTKDVGSTGREGFSPATAGEWGRNNIGVYGEIEADLTDRFLVGGAIRFEDYSDFGSDISYKGAARFKISDALSVRASASSSFRAPSMPQIHYSNFIQIAFDNDGNSVVTPFLPIRSQLVQENLGITNLEPEKSIDFAAGITSQLGDNFALTVDVYQIDIEDRIAVSGNIDASSFPSFNELNYDAVNVFTNALDTQTKGLDVVATYGAWFGNGSKLSLTAALNINSTEITATRSPQALENLGIDVVDSRAAVYITEATPRDKAIVSANYQRGAFSAILRGTRFGEVEDPRAGDADAGETIFSAKFVTDLSFSYQFLPQLTVSIGANNLFDTYPDLLASPQTSSEVVYSRRVNQFGTQGRFIHLSVNHLLGL